ncbi:hypothetical protein M0R45_026844 [Rubus argutus]|uniref:Uncharacterized protein n=1 Tax=Rubus argutus TaxID=59490 RepID=A0AAW1WYT3_RUBAR
MIALSWNVRGLGKPAQFPCSPAPTTDCFAVGSVGERREEWWFGVRLEDGVNIRILGFSQGHIDALLLLGREVDRGFFLVTLNEIANSGEKRGGLSLWPDLIEHYVDMGASDHLALVFNTTGGALPVCDKVNRRFQFEPFWIREASCMETIQETWELGSTEDSLVARLGNIGMALEKWSKQVIGSVQER